MGDRSLPRPRLKGKTLTPKKCPTFAGLCLQSFGSDQVYAQRRHFLGSEILPRNPFWIRSTRSRFAIWERRRSFSAI